MNFVVQNGTVLFRTSLHSRLGRQVSLGVAAFHVDEIDDYTESGWSVLLRGAVEPVETRDLPPAAARPAAWPSGERSLHLRLRPRIITGRRLVPA